MKRHTVIPFTKWLTKRWFSKVIYVYKAYDEMIVDSPGLGITLTLFISLFFSLLCLPIFVATELSFSSGAGVIIAMWAVCFGNCARIIFRELYNKFNQERQELFNMLKD